MKRTTRFRGAWASVTVGSLLLIAARGFAAGLMGMESGDLRISTDSTDYDIESGSFTMPHHVSATRPGTQLDGDHAHGNGKNKIVFLDGHVVVRNSGQGGNESPLSSGNNHEPSTLTTDHLTIELATKFYTAQGHVHFVQGKRIAVADHATLDDRTHDLHLMGHVHLEDNGQVLDAETLNYNTATEKVHADRNVSIIVPVSTAGPLQKSPLPGTQPKPLASASLPPSPMPMSSVMPQNGNTPRPAKHSHAVQ